VSDKPSPTEPVQVKKRAIDVTPYEHGIWCSVAGGNPFVNTIVLRKWSDDGSQVIFMLDSHNFLFAKPDEEIEVVEHTSTFYDAEFQAKRLAEDAKNMMARPVPAPPTERDQLRAKLASVKGDLAAAHVALKASADAHWRITAAYGARALLMEGVPIAPHSAAVVRAKLQGQLLTDDEINSVSVAAFEVCVRALAAAGDPTATIHECNPSEEP